MPLSSDLEAVDDGFFKGFVTKREIAKHVKRSPRTIDKYVADRKIPYFRVNSRLNLFKIKDVERALRKHIVHVREI